MKSAQQKPYLILDLSGHPDCVSIRIPKLSLSERNRLTRFLNLRLASEKQIEKIKVIRDRIEVRKNTRASWKPTLGKVYREAQKFLSSVPTRKKLRTRARILRRPEDRIEDLLKKVIRPAVEQYGSSIRLIDLTEGVAKFALSAFATLTPFSQNKVLLDISERILKLGDIKEVHYVERP